MESILSVGGEAGKEFVLDNQSTKMFLEASKNMGTGGEMVKELQKINNNTEINAKLLAEIAKRTLGNVVLNGGNNQQPQLPDTPTKLTYENANFSHN
jgi:hypothetical protein